MGRVQEANWVARPEDGGSCRKGARGCPCMRREETIPDSAGGNQRNSGSHTSHSGNA